MDAPSWHRYDKGEEPAMAVRVKCGACGKTVRGGDDWAGRRGRCPDCSAEIAFPPPEPDFDSIVEDALASSTQDFIPDDERHCPYCDEPIAIFARKCKHCGEFLDQAVRSERSSSFSKSYPKSVDRSWNPGLAAAFSFFIPGLGQIYKEQLGRGFAILFFTALGYFLLIIPGLCLHIWAVIDAATNQPERR